MTRRRPKALVGAALFAVLMGTPVDARQKQKKDHPQNNIDQHSIGGAVYGPHYQDKPYPWPTRIKRERGTPRPSSRALASTSRDCLASDTSDLLARLEARFGRVQLVSTCRPGARMPSGDVSWHARNKAFDFNVPKGVDKRDVMVWLGQNSSGVTMSYSRMTHIHADTGSFHKVIYNAASHEAGERAVAIWMERATAVAAIPLPIPRPEIPAAPIVVASLGDSDGLFVETPYPAPLVPAPLLPGDRRDILRRYVESKDVIVLPHTSLSCNGKAFPDGLVRLLHDTAAHFGSRTYVNSGYRTPERNRRVGGARNSQHMKCRAVDFRVAGVSVSDLRRYVMGNLQRWGVGGVGTYRTHLHADARPLFKATRVVTWTGGHKRYAKRRHQRYASAG